MADYVGAIDQGTTSTRFMIFDHGGTVIGVDQKEHEQIYPKPGWVEHDPDRDLDAHAGGGRRARSQKAELQASDLAAVGITNQRETTVVWDRTTGDADPQRARVAGHAHRQDRATSSRPTAARIGSAPRPGCRSPRTSPGPKITLAPRQRGRRAGARRGRRAAVRQHRHVGDLEPHRRAERRRARHRRHERQPHDADGPEDARVGRRAKLDAIGVPRADAAGDPASSSEVYGEAKGALAGVPVAGDLGDQQAALFGQACFDAGEAKNTYGTGNFLLLNTGTEPVPSQERPAHHASATSSATRPPCTAWRARSPSPARSCSGCATTSELIGVVRRGRGARGDRRGQRRRLLRAGLLRPVRAVLARATPAA